MKKNYVTPVVETEFLNCECLLTLSNANPFSWGDGDWGVEDEIL